MQDGPIQTPTGNCPGPSGPRTPLGLAAFTLAAALVVGTLLVPIAGLAALAATLAAGLGRALYRRLESGRHPPADASAPETRLRAE